MKHELTQTCFGFCNKLWYVQVATFGVLHWGILRYGELIASSKQQHSKVVFTLPRKLQWPSYAKKNPLCMLTRATMVHLDINSDTITLRDGRCSASQFKHSQSLFNLVVQSMSTKFSNNHRLCHVSPLLPASNKSTISSNRVVYQWKTPALWDGESIAGSKEHHSKVVLSVPRQLQWHSYAKAILFAC